MKRRTEELTILIKENEDNVGDMITEVDVSYSLGNVLKCTCNKHTCRYNMQTPASKQVIILRYALIPYYEEYPTYMATGQN